MIQTEPWEDFNLNVLLSGHSSLRLVSMKLSLFTRKARSFINNLFIALSAEVINNNVETSR